MDLQDLRVVLAIAETGSFTEAAESLHLTQPAISRRIKAMEANLGVRLFDRLGRDIRPTAAAEVLLPRAREIVLAMQDTETLLRSLDDEVAGTLRLATSHHIGLHRLAPALRTFTERYPDVQLDIRFEDSEEAHTLVRNATTELAVVTLDPNGPGELMAEPIWPDPLSFVAAPDHPLMNTADVSLDDLASQPCVLPDLGTYTGRIVQRTFANASVALKPAMATNYLETIAMLVGIGVGWSVLPDTMLSAEVRALDVAVTLPGRNLGIVSNPRRPLSNTAQRFAAILRESPASESLL